MKNLNLICTLRPSGVEGIGVFALRDLSEGALLPFFQRIKNISHFITPTRLRKMSELERRWCKRFGVREDGGYWVPNDPQMMDFGWFLNHSDSPNARCALDGFSYFVISPIKKGEEITINYNEIGDDDPDHSETDLFWDI